MKSISVFLLSILCSQAALAALSPQAREGRDTSVLLEFIRAHPYVEATFVAIDTSSHKVLFSDDCQATFKRGVAWHLPGWVGPVEPLKFKSSNCEIDQQFVVDEKVLAAQRKFKRIEACDGRGKLVAALDLSAAAEEPFVLNGASHRINTEYCWMMVVDARQPALIFIEQNAKGKSLSVVLLEDGLERQVLNLKLSQKDRKHGGFTTTGEGVTFSWDKSQSALPIIKLTQTSTPGKGDTQFMPGPPEERVLIYRVASGFYENASN